MQQPEFYWVAEIEYYPDVLVEVEPHFYWTGHVEPGWRGVTSTNLKDAQKYYTKAAVESDLKKIMQPMRGPWTVTKITNEKFRPTAP